MNGVSGSDYQRANLYDLMDRVSKLEQALAGYLNTVKWECYNCQTANETPELLWKSLRFNLICRKCSFTQNYPVHIAPIDPDPPDYIKERLARERELNAPEPKYEGTFTGFKPLP